MMKLLLIAVLLQVGGEVPVEGEFGGLFGPDRKPLIPRPVPDPVPDAVPDEPVKGFGGWLRRAEKEDSERYDRFRRQQDEVYGGILTALRTNREEGLRRAAEAREQRKKAEEAALKAEEEKLKAEKLKLEAEEAAAKALRAVQEARQENAWLLQVVNRGKNLVHGVGGLGLWLVAWAAILMVSVVVVFNLIQLFLSWAGRKLAGATAKVAASVVKKRV